MRARLNRHLRSNLIAYISLFVAMSGTAYSVDGSLAGRNTVGSADIMKGEVKSSDVGTNQIRSADVRNQDLAGGGLLGQDIVDGSLSGLDIFDGSISGSDIDETTLAKVPSARSADNGGTGRYQFAGSCDPESETYVDCATLTPVLSSPGRLLVIATVDAMTESDSDHMLGRCALYVNGVRYNASAIEFEGDDDGTDNSAYHRVHDNGTIVAVTTSVLAAGDGNTLAVKCNQGHLGAIQYPAARIVAVSLSAN